MHLPLTRHGTLVAAHDAPEGIPLTIRKGDPVQIGQRHARWTDYVWATDRSGSSGWVPLSVLDNAFGQAAALEDYSAQELTARPGERVRLLWQAGGWWWCENQDGDRGWLPNESVEPDQDPESA